MKIQKSDIEHTAGLAKLGITEIELSTFTEQIDSVLEHIATLEEVDTDGIESTNQVTGLTNITRKDIPYEYPKEKRDKLLSQTPKDENNYVIIPHLIK